MATMLSFFEDFGRCARIVAVAFAFLCCGGPVMLIVGAVVLAAAAKDNRKRELTVYNNAVDAWQSTGFTAFANAFPSGNASLAFTLPTGTLVRVLRLWRRAACLLSAADVSASAPSPSSCRSARRPWRSRTGAATLAGARLYL